MPEDRDSPPPFSERLKQRIDEFLALTGMSATEFGQRIMNDTSLYTRIKRGRPINSNTIDLIEELMRDYDYEPQGERHKGKG